MLKRDISPCNYITQNKKPKLKHSAINAGSIDFCTAPSWLINSRCSYKPIPALASPQQETNGRISKAEIPSCTDLLSARSFKKPRALHRSPSLNPTFRLPVLQSHTSHQPGKCQHMARGPRVQGQPLPAASCLPLPGTEAMLGRKGCSFGCKGQATSARLGSAPATTSSQNPLNPSVLPATPSPHLVWMQAAGWGDPLSFWGSHWKSLNLPRSIGDGRCCPSATRPGEHLPTPGACCFQQPPEGDLDAGTGVKWPKNNPRRGKAASLPQHQGPCGWRSR